jgi:hypothetical protein
VNTDSTYNLSIQRRSRTSLRINLPVDTEGIEHVMLNGVLFKLKAGGSKSETDRVILSRRRREELGEIIDKQFRVIHGYQPDLRNYQIYSKISDESKILLGLELGPRQIEGKHRTYIQFLEKQRRKNAPW